MSHAVTQVRMYKIKQIGYLVIVAVSLARCRHYDHFAGAVRFYYFFYLGEL